MNYSDEEVSKFDLSLNDQISEMSKKLKKAYWKRIEALLVCEVEILLGRIPSTDEIKKLGKCHFYTQTGEKVYFWGKTPLVKAIPQRDFGWKFECRSTHGDLL